MRDVLQASAEGRLIEEARGFDVGIRSGHALFEAVAKHRLCLRAVAKQPHRRQQARSEQFATALHHCIPSHHVFAPTPEFDRCA
jgi:hypothetical protein